MINYVEPEIPQRPRWRRNEHGYWLDSTNAGLVPVWVFEEIQAWSKEHNCGVRKAYGTWEFRNESEITMFLLRWGDK